jgi:outer membrane protein OmpA-like peptidoglycan-associated protein/ABC-type nitrate/sulfonate/bicarbonate transport system substrate-binding protein
MANVGKGVIVAAVIWIVIAAGLAIAYKFIVRPSQETELEQATSSESKYKHTIGVAVDSFSGYCVIRSKEFERGLAASGVKLEVKDDGADYAKRAKALRDGDVQLATFTIDSYITSSATLGDFPATVVMVIDETRGADAIVTRSDEVKSIQDLDHPDARLVLTPNSPSEFLARVVLAHFNLPSLPKDWKIDADGAEDAYRKLGAGSTSERRAYVLWEPFVSRAVEEGATVLLDSSKLRGYIVDVLVARREFLRDNPDLVAEFVGTYMRTAYSLSRRTGGMAKVVREDAERLGEKLNEKQADQLVNGIHWKNTLENYAHFGLLPSADAGAATHLEDMIARIVDVLVQTGALGADPLEGKASRIFYDGTLAKLKSDGFHPARKISILQGVDDGAKMDAVAVDAELKKLTDEEWNKLVPVGELRVKAISFARGTSRLHVGSRRHLTEVAKMLKAWPTYYLEVVGHARKEGDPEANRRLAEGRAKAAKDFFIEQGLSANRVRARSAPLTKAGGSAQSVSFVVGQPPY